MSDCMHCGKRENSGYREATTGSGLTIYRSKLGIRIIAVL